MRVTAFVGSPRPGGNTDTLVSEILRGASDAGTQTEKVLLNELAIRPCQACDACRRLGRCRIQDDMQSLYDKFLDSDVLVLGTPIYFWGPSAQIKAFIDRWYAVDQESMRSRLAGKTCQLVCAFADASEETAKHTVGLVRTSVEWLDMSFAEPLLGASLSEPKDAAHNRELMARAYVLGGMLAHPGAR